MKRAAKSLQWMLLVSGVLVASLGITAAFVPKVNLAALSTLIGGALLFSGVSELLSCFGQEKITRIWAMPVSGCAAILFGVLSIVGRGNTIFTKLFPFVFAGWVLFTGVARIAGALSLRTQGIWLWCWILGFCATGALLGLFLILSPMLSGLFLSGCLALMLIAYGMGNIMLFSKCRRLTATSHNACFGADRYGKDTIS